MLRNTITINDLYKALRKSWSKETAYKADAERWCEGNPAYGQDAITAIIVQDIFGGEIQRGNNASISHYWNVINERKIDLTKEQFNYDINFSNVTTADKKNILSSEDTRKRYELLKKNLIDQGFDFLNLKEHKEE